MTTEHKFIAPSEKILCHPDLINDVKTRTSRIPIHFEIDPTNRCNLACEGCHFAYVHGTPGDSSQDMSSSLYYKIIADMRINEVKAITFTGGGEPLFHPHHLDMFKVAHTAGLQMGLYTNGVLLEGNTAAFVAANFEWCYISLDAADPKDYAAYKHRSENVFWKNIYNIRHITKLPDRKATIGVGYLVGRHNIDKIDEDIPYLQSLGADYIQARPLIDVGSYAEQKAARKMAGMAFEIDDKALWQEHYSWIPQAIEILDKYRLTPGIDTSRRKFTDLYSGTRKYDTCLSTSLTGSIGAKGEVWMCVNRRHTVGAKLGDLNTQTFQEIYEPKGVAVENLRFCRLMCRNDQLNQTLAKIDKGGDIPKPNSDLRHINFI